ncbi:UNVERIFIED_CONTAM: hypothetical protein NCL1_15349 [Trichonephila clavipes]
MNDNNAGGFTKYTLSRGFETVTVEDTHHLSKTIRFIQYQNLYLAPDGGDVGYNTRVMWLISRNGGFCIVFKFFEILMHFRERQLYSRDFLDIPGKPETLHTGRPTGEVTSKNMSLTDGLDELQITTRYLSNGHSEVLTQHLGISGEKECV